MNTRLFNGYTSTYLSQQTYFLITGRTSFDFCFVHRRDKRIIRDLPLYNNRACEICLLSASISSCSFEFKIQQRRHMQLCK
jgi:hypothetical protein